MDKNKEIALTELSELLREMTISQVLAIHAFAVCLRVGGVHPQFFTLIADALEDRGGEQ